MAAGMFWDKTQGLHTTSELVAHLQSSYRVKCRYLVIIFIYIHVELMR